MINSYCGYSYNFPHKMKVQLSSSYNSEDKHNYAPTVMFKIGDAETYLTVEEADKLQVELSNMISIIDKLPHKDNRREDNHAW